MHRRYVAAATLVALAATAVAACAPPTAPESPDPAVGVARAALGEPRDGFPSWDERAIHLLMNRARSDPQAEFAASCSPGCCGDQPCYGPVPPYAWNYNLTRAARFHSTNLTSSGCSIQHPSPCLLVTDIGTRYTPGPCDGTVACACQPGTQHCGGGAGVTDTFARISEFGSGANFESIASGGPGDPVREFTMWYCEGTSRTTCGYGSDNGHRYAILTSQVSAVGVGCAGRFCTADFGGGGERGQITVGAHFPGGVFRAHWYAPAEPQQALVNLDGTCYPMSKERGLEPGNSAYAVTQSPGSGCHHYFFAFKDSGGMLVTYPETGSFGIGCGVDWDPATRPPTGAGCNCQPDCAGRQCGDDGCGGACPSSCGPTQTCAGTVCVCQGPTCGAACCAAGEVCFQGTCCRPQCAGKQCGSDGCGGTCAPGCSGALTCGATGQCGCAPGLTACGASCVDLTSDGHHCGGCGVACGPSLGCAASQCVASCPTGRTNCGGSCLDLSADAAHCGACDHACAAGLVCAAGGCACPPGFTACPGPGCADLAGDPANCGACGRACAEGSCAHGRCPGETRDGGLDADDGGEAAGGQGLVGQCGCAAPAGAGPAGALLALLVALGRPRARGRRAGKGSLRPHPGDQE